MRKKKKKGLDSIFILLSIIWVKLSTLLTLDLLDFPKEFQGTINRF